MIESRKLSSVDETQCTSEPQSECSNQAKARGVESLNSDCFCISLDTEALKREFETDPETRSLYPLILEKYPHLFAAMPVFVSQHHLDRMAAIVRAAHTVIALTAYQDIVLGWAPQVAHFDAGGARGVFLSYDFHVSSVGPKLIEINTNAGGALLNASLARAQRACCPAIAGMTTSTVALGVLNQSFVSMFIAEWRLARRPGSTTHRHRRRPPSTTVPLSRISSVPATFPPAWHRGSHR